MVLVKIVLYTDYFIKQLYIQGPTNPGLSSFHIKPIAKYPTLKHFHDVHLVPLLSTVEFNILLKNIRANQMVFSMSVGFTIISLHRHRAIAENLEII